MIVYIQRLIKWMPLILFVLLLMVDRKNTFHVVCYITLLLSYTGILVSKILYAKEEWHNEFNNNIDKGSDEIDKMSDYQDQLNVKDETDTKS